MDGICRLCLSFSDEKMCHWNEQSEKYANIYSCLSLRMPINNLLPNQVCHICIKTIMKMNEFCIKVKQNEDMLYEKLNLGENVLKMFYKSLKCGLKLEIKETDLENEETQTLKTNEGSALNKLKHETNDTNIVDYNSEDDVPLLKMKEHKNSNIINDINQESDNFNHKCLTCFDLFDTQINLLNHYNEMHKSKEKISKNYSVIAENGKLMYKCDKCFKIYNDKRSITKHSYIHSDEKFHCKICGRTYRTVSDIIRHGRAHNGTKVACSFQCGFASVYLGALREHEKRHKKDFKYKCETCSKSFQVKTWYEQHQNIHKGIKPYVCDVCGMAFHMDRYLTSHRSTVHPKSSQVHRYVCVQCSIPCGSMKALTLHLKEHGITSSFLCDLCGKTLSSAEQLKIHKRVHSGVKPYSCSTCDKSFVKRSNLKLHEVTHSGERAHACVRCGKHYTQRSALLRHNKRHHSGLSQKCSKCQKSFKNENQLESHQKICLS